MMMPEEIIKNLFALKSCACDIAREAFASDPSFDPNNPDENSEAYERFEVAKELGKQWGCPNWSGQQIKFDKELLPEHQLEKINNSIPELKDKKHLAVIKGYENFLELSQDQKGKCYKTCPKFYHTKNSPLFEQIKQSVNEYRWFIKGQFSVVNTTPSQFDIDAIDCFQDGNAIADKYFTSKMKKENEEMKKKFEEEKNKSKTKGIK